MHTNDALEQDSGGGWGDPLRGKCTAITHAPLSRKGQHAEPYLLADGTSLDIACPGATSHLVMTTQYAIDELYNNWHTWGAVETDDANHDITLSNIKHCMHVPHRTPSQSMYAETVHKSDVTGKPSKPSRPVAYRCSLHTTVDLNNTCSNEVNRAPMDDVDVNLSLGQLGDASMWYPATPDDTMYMEDYAVCTSRWRYD